MKIDWTYDELMTEFSLKELDEIEDEINRRIGQMIVQQDLSEMLRVLEDIKFIKKNGKAE
jgi:DNA-binding HxlR family transcriptional regulator